MPRCISACCESARLPAAIMRSLDLLKGNVGACIARRLVKCTPKICKNALKPSLETVTDRNMGLNHTQGREHEEFSKHALNAICSAQHQLIVG